MVSSQHENRKHNAKQINKRSYMVSRSKSLRKIKAVWKGALQSTQRKWRDKCLTQSTTNQLGRRKHSFDGMWCKNQKEKKKDEKSLSLHFIFQLCIYKHSFLVLELAISDHTKSAHSHNYYNKDLSVMSGGNYTSSTSCETNAAYIAIMSRAS